MSNLGSTYHLSSWRTCKICGEEFYGYKKNICEYCKDIINRKLKRRKRKEVNDE